jgi:hypothetical protein
VLVLCLLVHSTAQAENLVVNAGNTQHIQFKRIAPSAYRFEQDSLHIAVSDSASFLLLPFKQNKIVSAVRFDWKLEAGELRLENAAHEARRDGDDAVFKLGLLIEGKPGLPAPLAPKWLKQASEALSYPSNRMIYIVAGAKHAAGDRWTSPYNRNIEMLAADERKQDNGWSQASHAFDSPVSVIGIWLMADGDNTDSTFLSRVRNIGLVSSPEHTR